ncbi:type IV pilus assembly protein PilM [Tumebacillus sp. DT12]|uniref:Type IV pilus assembly protein PilM n=1 Tax=Tumebacillus lacus TaxID=2995335 RepID=A0ABT3X3B2_9BACL|nr:type IV pilus assembly protein PilM [Tumebacillus lacus]MCX7571397.1 type IV pilus assembly protein PilM [Tumebacillus lacus]
MFSITPDTALGLEITDQRLLLAEVFKKRDRSVLQGIVQTSIPSEVIEDGKIKQVDTLAELLRRTLREGDIRTKRVNLVVPSQFVVIRQLQMPDLPKKQIRKLIDFELQNSIHLPFDEPFYDFVKVEKNEGDRASQALIDAEAATGQKMCDITLIASSRAAIDSVVETARLAGLKPQSVDIRALALDRACRILGSEADQRQATMYVDVAEASTDVHIFQGNVLKFTRNVPIPLDSYRLNRERAKPLNVLEILDYLEQNTDYSSFTSDLAYEVERSLNFFRYTLNNRDAALRHLVLTGLLPKSGVLVRYLQERLPDMTVFTMPFQDLEIKGRAATDADSLYEYAIPIGLALKEVR